MSETTTVVQSTPEKAPVRESLETLAAAKHSAFAAKINGSIFGKEREVLQAQYDNAESAYVTALREEVSTQLETTEFDTIDQRIDYFELIVNERIALDREAQQAELIAQGGKRAEFLAWYANLPKGKKIAATVGLAAGGAAAGALMSMAGAGVATVAVSIGAYRLARGYNMRAAKLYENPKEQLTFTADREAPNDESIDRAMAFLRKDSQSTIERAEAIKKRAIVGAIGAVALGSAAGYGVREALEDTSIGEAVSSKISDWTDKLSNFFIPPASATEAHLPALQPGVPAHEINDNLSGRNANVYGRGDVDASADAAPAETSAISQSFTVEKGHGYTHELMQSVKEVYGIELTKQEAWELHKELVRTAGSDYINLLDHSGSDTYSMGDSRYEVGLSGSGEAEWSDKAIKVLDQKFGDHDVDADASSDDAPAPADVAEAPARNLVEGTGGQDFDQEVVEVAPRDTSHNLVQGTGGPDMPAETAADAAADNANSEELEGLVDAKEDVANGFESLYEVMKNDAYEMRGMMLAGDIESINNDYSFQTTLDYIQQDIGNMTYPGTDVPIIEKTGSDFTSQWVVNEFPEGVTKMPDSVIKVFEKYIDSLQVLAP